MIHISNESIEYILRQQLKLIGVKTTAFTTNVYQDETNCTISLVFNGKATLNSIEVVRIAISDIENSEMILHTSHILYSDTMYCYGTIALKYYMK